MDINKTINIYRKELEIKAFNSQKEKVNQDFNNMINSYEHKRKKVLSREEKLRAKMLLAKKALEKCFNPLLSSVLLEIRGQCEKDLASLKPQENN